MKNKFLKIAFGILLAAMPFSLSAEEMGIADPARDKYYSALEGKKSCVCASSNGF
jgi:nitrogenase molybdenum-iron protein alpha/beta subunit